MSPPRAEYSSRSRALRWLLPTAPLAFAPKCLVCLWAYAGLGAALGLGGREMCGAPAASLDSWQTPFAFAAFAIGA